MSRMQERARAAIAQIDALPKPRRSTVDPRVHDNCMSYLLENVQYDWAVINSALFPDGNPLNLDLTSTQARAEWKAVRLHNRQLVEEAFAAWVPGTDFKIERGGIVAFIDAPNMDALDPCFPAPREVTEVALTAFPEYFLRANDVYRVRPVPERHYPGVEQPFASAAVYMRNEQHRIFSSWLPSRGIAYDQLGEPEWRSLLSQLDQDWGHWAKVHVKSLRSPSTWPNNETLSAPKKGLTDFLQARLDKARLRFDHSTAREQFTALPMLGARAKTAKTNRTWGIELEIIDAKAIVFDASAGWKRERDGSLRSQIGDGRTYDPWEFVSPILDRTYDDGLWMICDQAKNTVKYHKAGIHVHVSATTRRRKAFDPVAGRVRMVGGERMTTAQVSRLIELYATVAPLLDPIILRTKTREFCVPTRVDQWADGWFEQPTSKKPHRVRPLRKRSDDAIKNAKWWAQITKGPNHDNEATNWKRHQELNLQALNKYGTIEFRAMGANYDYDYLTRWAWLCRAMVDFAQSDAPMRAVYQLTDFNSLAHLLNRYAGEPLNLGRKAA